MPAKAFIEHDAARVDDRTDLLLAFAGGETTAGAGLPADDRAASARPGVKRWLDAVSPRGSVAFKVAAAIVLLLAIDMAMALAAAWVGFEYSRTARRGELAQSVLHASVMLSSEVHQLEGAVSREASPDRENPLLAQLDRIRNRYTAALNAVQAEIAFLAGSDPENEEDEELLVRQVGERLQQLSSVVRSLNERPLIDVRAVAALAAEQSRLQAIIHGELEQLVVYESEELLEGAARMRALSEMHKTILISATVVSFVAALLSIMILWRAVRRPFQELVDGVSAFAKGDLGHRIHLTGDDEFGRLAATINVMAAELEKGQNALQETVRERTSELEGVNLRLAQISARRQQFISDIGHELRTPLTIMRGEADVTLRKADASPSEYRSALERVRRQVQHTSDLVDDMLFVAASESGNAPVAALTVDLAQLVRDVCASVTPGGALGGRDLEVRVDCDEAPVMGDAKRLRRLLLILLENAVQYSPAGSKIAFELDGNSDPRVVKVSNSCPDLMPGEVELAFERYYRGARARRTHPHGSGLGLPLAKAIAESHGGSISLAIGGSNLITVTVALPSTTGSDSAL